MILNSISSKIQSTSPFGLILQPQRSIIYSPFLHQSSVSRSSRFCKSKKEESIFTLRSGISYCSLNMAKAFQSKIQSYVYLYMYSYMNMTTFRTIQRQEDGFHVLLGLHQSVGPLQTGSAADFLSKLPPCTTRSWPCLILSVYCVFHDDCFTTAPPRGAAPRLSGAGRGPQEPRCLFEWHSMWDLSPSGGEKRHCKHQQQTTGFLLFEFSFVS